MAAKGPLGTAAGVPGAGARVIARAGAAAPGPAVEKKGEVPDVVSLLGVTGDSR